MGKRRHRSHSLNSDYIDKISGHFSFLTQVEGGFLLPGHLSTTLARRSFNKIHHRVKFPQFLGNTKPLISSPERF
jgi:hypothetical protein